MGRNAKVIFQDPVSKVLFARWYEGGKKYRLTLNTIDFLEATQRLPAVQQSKMSWNQLQKSIGNMGALVVNAIDQHRISPPIQVKATPDGLHQMINTALPSGNAFFDTDRGYWILKAMQDGTPTDSTAMPVPAHMPAIGDQIFRGINTLRMSTIQDNSKEIETFYTITMLQLYTDKKTALRSGEIWLRFLKHENVISWAQINEELVIAFKEWRKVTPVSRGTNSNAPGVLPSALVLNRHIKYLEKSFNKAVHDGYMKKNPIFEWKPESHISQPQKGLSIEELKSALSKLTGAIFDIVLLLFCSCKRRKEIAKLQIENINFQEHFAHYVEFKNSSKGTQYSIHKAFYLTTAMEMFLKRIMNGRTSGPLFIGVDPEVVSDVFTQVAEEVAPSKGITLKNLRQTCTDCMEKAGLEDDEIDAVLGHINVSKALIYYQDRSADAIARRLAKRTKRGVEVLSKTVEEFLQ